MKQFPSPLNLWPAFNIHSLLSSSDFLSSLTWSSLLPCRGFCVVVYQIRRLIVRREWQDTINWGKLWIEMLQPRLRSITSNFYICRMRSCLPNQKPVFLQFFLASLHSQMRVIGYSRLRPQCKCEDQYAKPRVEVLDSLEAPSFLAETCSVFLCTICIVRVIA